jgi:hypothetical protein
MAPAIEVNSQCAGGDDKRTSPSQDTSCASIASLRNNPSGISNSSASSNRELAVGTPRPGMIQDRLIRLITEKSTTLIGKRISF